MSETIKINIQVGEVKHPLTVAKEEEPIFREAARVVNERVVSYQTKYRAAKLPRDFIMAFAALDIAARYVRMQHTTDVRPVEEALQELNKQLEDFNRGH